MATTLACSDSVCCHRNTTEHTTMMPIVRTGVTVVGLSSRSGIMRSPPFPSLAAQVELAARASANSAIHQQDDDGADDRGDESCVLARLVDAQELSEIGGDEGAADANQRSHDESARIAAGHEELGNQPDDGADEDDSDEVQHDLA